jgi:hypothetical protein
MKCSVGSLCCNVYVQEFVELLQQATSSKQGRLEPLEAPFADYGLPSRFSQQHTAVQFVTLTSALIAAAAAH